MKEPKNCHAWIAALLLLLLLPAACKRDAVIRVDPRKTIETDQHLATTVDPQPLRIALGAVLTPKQGVAYYRQLLDYTGTKLGRSVEFIEKSSYAEVNALLAAGHVDMAFVCSKPYVDGKAAFGLEILVAPEIRGKAEYYSYVIVPMSSTVTNLAGLRGHTFAFTDPMSNTGRLAPLHRLRKMNETPDTFFSRSIFTYAHDKTIKMVAQKVVDAGAVDSLVWDYESDTGTGFASRTRIIERLGPFDIPPVVIRPGLDAELKSKLRHIFLNAHLDEDGRHILEHMHIDRFVEVRDEAYNTIRAMIQPPRGREKTP